MKNKRAPIIKATLASGRVHFLNARGHRWHATIPSEPDLPGTPTRSERAPLLPSERLHLAAANMPLATVLPASFALR